MDPNYLALLYFVPLLACAVIGIVYAWKRNRDLRLSDVLGWVAYAVTPIINALVVIVFILMSVEGAWRRFGDPVVAEA